MPVYMFFAPPQEGDNVPRITVKPESLDTAIPIAIDYLAEVCSLRYALN